ncbi:hypothetical protein PPUN15366_19060 [Pseudomonas putida]|uniref:hypothetical protein n=1 Tax=Pseudomonas putida TaxID=303 RepID=UPI00235DBEF8|nr:hypothetical protein [Pseudomonas putida]GLO40262.1 hypothetical protein PPUN15366_19060 [Pseudomonas putida]HDS0978128.1 hypothetical protein [Pseudomonas putida]
MLQLLFTVAATLFAALVSYLSARAVSKRSEKVYKVIEFTVQGGKAQRIKVSSLEPEVIKEAVDTELRLESFIRAAFKDMVRSNGKIRVSEDDVADFVVTQGDRVVVVEAKAGIENLPDDFVSKISDKYDRPSIILLVGKEPINSQSLTLSDNSKVIRAGAEVGFKDRFIKEVLSALNAKF